MLKTAALLLLVLLLTGCRTGRSYGSPDSPRYTRAATLAAAANSSGVDTLRIVTFNIEYSLQIDSAIALLKTEPSLKDVDVLLLQEMNEEGTSRIAAALEMGYAYYPAIYNFKHSRDVGNAVLSRWPIVEDAKIILPHQSRFVGTSRTTTAATIRIGDTPVRVYSAHLGTIVNVSAGERRDQLRAILADAERYPRVILGGDLNNSSVGRVARDAGYLWVTEHGPRTTPIGRIDHVFLKGLVVPDSGSSGTVLDVRNASDHRAVWARAILRHTGPS